MEVRDIVQETGIKTIPMEKKCKKAKWLSEEAIQIALKRIEAKSKGEKERYKHLNAEFQTIARRDKKAVFSDQCKEIEENSRMGKTRDLFKKMTNLDSILKSRDITLLTKFCLVKAMDFPGNSTRVDCHFLLQWIFPTRGSNPGLLHCRQTLYRKFLSFIKPIFA